MQILAGETARSSEGLALSSRNSYLSEAQREEALRLSRTLKTLIADWQSGRRDLAALEAAALQQLSEHGWQPDYVCLRRQVDLGTPDGQAEGQPLVALAAARLGATRLIDNLEL